MTTDQLRILRRPRRAGRLGDVDERCARAYDRGARSAPPSRPCRSWAWPSRRHLPRCAASPTPGRALPSRTSATWSRGAGAAAPVLLYAPVPPAGRASGEARGTRGAGDRRGLGMIRIKTAIQALRPARRPAARRPQRLGTRAELLADLGRRCEALARYISTDRVSGCRRNHARQLRSGRGTGTPCHRVPPGSNSLTATRSAGRITPAARRWQ